MYESTDETAINAFTAAPAVTVRVTVISLWLTLLLSTVVCMDAERNLAMVDEINIDCSQSVAVVHRRTQNKDRVALTQQHLHRHKLYSR